MSWIYRAFVRPVLFAQESESIHTRTLRLLGVLSRNALLRKLASVLYAAPDLPVSVFGCHFKNPVGVAAGMDKYAEAVPAWECLGFGFTELGGVTRHSQPGNDRPRVFRIIPEKALINRMGFNNPGAEEFAARLKEWKDSNRWPRHPIGINLGKSKTTPLEDAASDFAFSYQCLRDHADFFVLNVSSPNTPNLRKLQDRAQLDGILGALQELQADGSRKRPPILIKVAPDLTDGALDDIVELALDRGIAGIVATNTTVTRPEAAPSRLQKQYSETGGLSGRPLTARSTEVIGHIFRQSRGKLPIIGVGGVFDANDAWEKITAGASLIQVYTGLVYEGPAVAGDIVRGLRRKLAEAGLGDLASAVGIGTTR